MRTSNHFVLRHSIHHTQQMVISFRCVPLNADYGYYTNDIIITKTYRLDSIIWC